MQSCISLYFGLWADSTDWDSGFDNNTGTRNLLPSSVSGVCTSLDKANYTRRCETCVVITSRGKWMKHSYTNPVLPRVAKTVVSRLLCSGLGIAARFFSNLLHYVIRWLYLSATPRNYPQNVPAKWNVDAASEHPVSITNSSLFAGLAPPLCGFTHLPSL